jgi:MFS family permease
MFGLASLTWLVPWLLASRGLQAHPSSRPAAPAPAFREILGRRALWGAGLGHFACNYGFYFVVSWLPLYLVKAQGYTMAGMARMGGLVYVTYAVGSLLGGLLTDAWMGAGASPNRARKAVLVGSHALAAAGLAVSAVSGPQLALAGMFLTALTLGAISPNIFATGQTCAGPHAAGKWMGVQNCLGNVAGIVGPLATGFIVESAFGFRAAFGLAAAVTLLGAVGWGLVIPKIAPATWTAPSAPPQWGGDAKRQRKSAPLP